MINKSIFLIFFLCFSSILFAQESRHNNINIEISPSVNNQEDIILNLSFNFVRKQHEFFLGPKFPLSGKSNTIIGLNLGYKFFPNKVKTKFDMFFHYNIQVVNRKLYYNSSKKGFALYNIIGYGFNFNFNKNMYLTHSLGIGIENSWFKDYDIFTDIAALFKLGIGYKLKVKKK